eukprot:2697857-Amphidinium_carterae.2
MNPPRPPPPTKSDNLCAFEKRPQKSEKMSRTATWGTVETAQRTDSPEGRGMKKSKSAQFSEDRFRSFSTSV